jgi:hypothetical protein
MEDWVTIGEPKGGFSEVGSLPHKPTNDFHERMIKARFVQRSNTIATRSHLAAQRWTTSPDVKCFSQSNT